MTLAATLRAVYMVSVALAAPSGRMTAIWCVPRRLGAAWRLPTRDHVCLCVRRAFVLLGKSDQQRLDWQIPPGLTQSRPLGTHATVERRLLAAWNHRPQAGRSWSLGADPPATSAQAQASAVPRTHQPNPEIRGGSTGVRGQWDFPVSGRSGDLGP